MQMVSHTFLPILLLLPFLSAASADVAPGPTPPELNLTSILYKGGQYTTLLRLLQATRITEQLSSQLKNSYDGLTFFAPNDNAFAKLKVGTLNGLTDQQQVQLVLYHVLPRYYSVTTFQTASNPLRTEASGPGGVYSVNVTTSTTSQLVNVSTGVVAVPISNTLFAEFPLAVYSVDDVLQPEQLFGRKANNAAAPVPGQAGEAAGKATARKKGVPKSDVAAEPSASGQEAEDSTNAAARGRGCVEWGTVVAFALMAVVNLVGA
ncbi:fasciclin-like arabinogalactan protein 6 [Phragmites australis]|uniref:fasciclin-like arabinogalactan protein 6 n=1 Tax=Phragmites australis TaxID=29695 RepID=UPI002D77749D|nr:fasciclin-like arabinogalactan protein 6 [Phragmites australis]